jgi:UDP-N-acetylenolpyruvoylglucosamine reductase
MSGSCCNPHLGWMTANFKNGQKRSAWMIYSERLSIMHDTAQNVEEHMTRMMALKSPVERLSMAGSMFDAAKKLMTAGILKENPDLSPDQSSSQAIYRFSASTAPLRAAFDAAA